MQALGKFVIIKRIEKPPVSKGGILMPDIIHESTLQEGVVVSVGRKCRIVTESGIKVLYPLHNATPLRDKGYYHIHENYILAEV